MGVGRGRDEEIPGARGVQETACHSMAEPVPTRPRRKDLRNLPLHP